MNILSKLTTNLLTGYQKNKPMVYAGIAIAASIGGAISAANTSYKLNETMHQMKAEEALIEDPDELKKRKFKRYMRVVGMYAPAVLMEGLAIASVVTSYKASVTRTAAFATAYMLSQEDFTAYKSKVVDILGQKKADNIEKEAAVAKVKDTPLPDESEIIATGDGNTLFYDKIGGRYFRSSIDAVRSAEKKVSDWIHAYDSAAVNDFYGFLGLEDTVAGGVLGWNNERPIDINLNSTRIGPNNEPAFVITYNWLPLVAYDQINR